MRPPFLILFAVLSCGAGEPCTPCRDPNDSYASPDKEVDLPGFGVVPCGVLEQLLPSMFQIDDDNCQQVQSIGTFCGCAVEENACTLCASYDESAVVSNFLDDLPATCELASSYLQSLTDDDDECYALKKQWSSSCGCVEDKEVGPTDVATQDPSSSSNISSSTPTADDTVSISGYGNGSCTLCVGGDLPQFGSYDLSPHLMTETAQSYESVRAMGNLTFFSCTMMDNALRYGLAPGMCGSLFARLAAGVCGCQPIQNACNFCQDDEEIPLPDFIDPGISARTGLAPTCKEVRLGLSQFDENDYLCWTSETIAFHCGCYDGNAKYFGTTSTTKHALLVWAPRFTGLLSLLGSLFILRRISRTYRRCKKLSTYHLLLVGMSVFDCSSSIAWMFSSLPLPVSDRNGDLGIYGAHGTATTCKVQGFFFQLGFIGSTSFNASLTFFYLLVIVYRYTDFKLRRLQKYLLAIPVLIAVVLAAAAIPKYGQAYKMCQIPGPYFMPNTNVFIEGNDEAGKWLYVIIYNILPVGLAITICVTNMTIVCFFVWRTSLKGNRWMFPSATTVSVQSRQTRCSISRLRSKSNGSSEELGPSSHISECSNRPARRKNRPTKAVFAQGFWYTVSVSLTFVVFLIVQIKPVWGTDEKTFAFGIALVTLNPLMGFWNAFVFVKPWTWKWRTCSLCKRAKDPGEADLPPPASSHYPRATGYSGCTDFARKSSPVSHDSIDVESLPHGSDEEFYQDSDELQSSEEAGSL